MMISNPLLDVPSQVDKSRFVYLNILLTNGATDGSWKNCEFSENRRIPYLPAPARNYEVALCRFTCSTASIPVFQWKPNTYYIGFADEGTNVVHTREVTLVQPDNFGEESDQVFSYTNFVNNVNYHIKALWDAMRLAYPLANYQEGFQPIMHYDGQTSKVSWSVKHVFEEPPPAQPYWFGSNQFVVNPVNTMRFYLSSAFYTQFSCATDCYHLSRYDELTQVTDPVTPIKLPVILKFDAGDPKSVFYRDSVIPANPGRYAFASPAGSLTYDHIVAKSQFSSVWAWTKFRRIVFCSSTITINPEAIGFSLSGIPASIQVFGDLEMSWGIQQMFDRSSLNYTPTKLKWASLLSDGDLRDIDMRIYFQTYDDLKLNLLKLPPNCDCSVKLVFRKRSQEEPILIRLMKELTKETRDEKYARITNQPW